MGLRLGDDCGWFAACGLIAVKVVEQSTMPFELLMSSKKNVRGFWKGRGMRNFFFFYAPETGRSSQPGDTQLFPTFIERVAKPSGSLSEIFWTFCNSTTCRTEPTSCIVKLRNQGRGNDLVKKNVTPSEMQLRCKTKIFMVQTLRGPVRW